MIGGLDVAVKKQNVALAYHCKNMDKQIINNRFSFNNLRNQVINKI